MRNINRTIRFVKMIEILRELKNIFSDGIKAIKNEIIKTLTDFYGM